MNSLSVLRSEHLEGEGSPQLKLNVRNGWEKRDGIPALGHALETAGMGMVSPPQIDYDTTAGMGVLSPPQINYETTAGKGMVSLPQINYETTAGMGMVSPP